MFEWFWEEKCLSNFGISSTLKEYNKKCNNQIGSILNTDQNLTRLLLPEVLVKYCTTRSVFLLSCRVCSSHMVIYFQQTVKGWTRQNKQLILGKGAKEGRREKKEKIKKLPQTDYHFQHSSHGKAKLLKEQHILVWKHRPDLEQIGEGNHEIEILYSFTKLFNLRLSGEPWEFYQ